MDKQANLNDLYFKNKVFPEANNNKQFQDTFGV